MKAKVTIDVEGTQKEIDSIIKVLRNRITNKKSKIKIKPVFPVTDIYYGLYRKKFKNQRQHKYKWER